VLGVDSTVSSTAIITNVIECELPTTPTRHVANLPSCDVGIVEFRLGRLSPVLKKAARQVALPAGCSMVGVVRDGKVVTSFDALTLHSDDTVLALVAPEQEAAVRDILLG
jgi:Trk K+ transport system NAD-binding subunit